MLNDPLTLTDPLGAWPRYDPYLVGCFPDFGPTRYGCGWDPDVDECPPGFVPIYGTPETNGFCERFHRTLQEEFFAVAFRKTFYESVDQLQADLDGYLEFYNRERAHQGYRTQGRTPYQAFLDGGKQMQETSLMEEANNLPQERVA